MGRELAQRGATVVCGGHTIGILPGGDPAEANPYVEFPIATGLGYARNAIVARAGRAVIAIDGSEGTLSEIAFALVFGTPVVGLRTWEMSVAGRADTRVIRASNPLDAVGKALAAAGGRE